MYNPNANIIIAKTLFNSVISTKLAKFLGIGGYIPTGTGHPPGLFKYRTRSIFFCLVVDDFGVKYTSHNNAQHLISHLSKAYKCTVDWDGQIFLGIHLNWDYVNQRVDLSIPNYITKARQSISHKLPV